MRDKIIAAIIGGFLTVGAALGSGVANVGDTPQPSRTVNVQNDSGTVTIAVPSPSELSCPLRWIEKQRDITHIDGAVKQGQVGFIVCETPTYEPFRSGYVLSQTLGGEPIIHDSRGILIRDAVTTSKIINEAR